jgi:predicted O-linked N-acetylglucosamine transferase (SPINDLY family)
MDAIQSIEEIVQQSDVLTTMYNEAQTELIEKGQVNSEKYIECINISQKIIKFLDEQNPFVIARHSDVAKSVYYISAELLVRTVGLSGTRQSLTDVEKNNLHIAVAHLRQVLSLEPLHIRAKELYKLVFMYLTMFNSDAKENIMLLNQVLTVDPCDYQLHYNLGFMFHRLNQLDSSLYHYKLALGLLGLLLEKELPNTTVEQLKQFQVKVLNGLGGIYFTIQDRQLALYYFNLAYEIDPLDPDINNQLGVVYTELRNTEKAIYHYEKGIENYNQAHISVDKDMLIASMFMNMGLAKCYECDFTGAIDGYNQALKYKPRLSLAYQNKLLDVNYISHLIEDPMYVARLHKNINKIYPQVIDNYKVSCPTYKPNTDILQYSDKNELQKKGAKLNIGFVSGDFICHPVAYFIHSILKHLNYDLFNVFCYSAKVVKLDDMFKECNWFVVKNMSPEEMKALIQSHNIDILFDLSAHTGDNRLDTFVLKPAPIQISYCGYPNSSGIKSMDYRITDRFCDSEKSQKYYVEKLLFMENSFLAYTPSMGIENLPALAELQPSKKNGYITFGCFNRYNKINKMVIGVWEKILKAIPDARFVIKTKEFLTPKLKQQFLDSFDDKSVLDRVQVLPYSDTYLDHLPDYNLMDISLDTFPYSGTTTSCESLCMGVPVLTLFDNVRHYHSQNVTTSLMKNSGLEGYVTYSEDEYVEKAVLLAQNMSQLDNLKHNVRDKFVNGHVCNYKEFVNDFENMMLNTYKNHSW